jgi:flavin-dependent dehydrogenase
VIIFDDNPGSKKVSAVTFTEIIPFEKAIRKKYSSYTLMTVDGEKAEYEFGEDIFCLVDYRTLCKMLIGRNVVRERVKRYSENVIILPDEKIKAKVIVDCSGVQGEKMREIIGFKNPPEKNVISFETLKGDFELRKDSIYFLVGCTTFGGWIYPVNNNTIEFGMANRFKTGDEISFPDLDQVKKIIGIKGESTGVSKSIFPHRFVKKVVNKNIVLFGDACGLTHPAYGMSLHYIYKLAPILSKYIKDHIKGYRKLSDYQIYWKNLLRRASNLIAQGYSSWELSVDEQIKVCKTQMRMGVSSESIRQHIWALDEKVEFYAKNTPSFSDYPIKLHLKTLINKIKIWL